MNKNIDSSDNKVNSFISDMPSAAAAYLSTTMKGSQTAQLVTGNGAIALDLVVVIDTSGSMSDEASDLSKQIDAAIEKASANCPSRLRATFLGIEGTWAGTKFDQSASEYLIKLGVNERDLQARLPFRESDGRDHAGNKEDLCRAVIDISKHFDWRDDARRAIFVLGDEGMEGGGGILTRAAIAKNNEAISVAQEAGVKVYTYQGTPDDSPTNLDRFPTLADRDNVTREYERLAKETDGRAYIYTTGIANFVLVLEEVLCDSLTPPVLPHKDPVDCDSVCEQLPNIIAAVNKMSDIINRTIDSCCGKESRNYLDQYGKR
ncbi:hypothetical protein AHYW_000423 [Providencia manganoxydans]